MGSLNLANGDGARDTGVGAAEAAALPFRCVVPVPFVDLLGEDPGMPSI